MTDTRRQQVFRQINLVMLFITASSFILSQFIFMIIAFAWLFLALIEWNWKERYLILKENHLLTLSLCFLSLYLCYLVSPLLSDNVGKAISDWEYKIWLLTGPICIMPLIPKLQRKELTLTAILFTVPFLVWAIVSMGHCTYCFARSGCTQYFFYQLATPHKIFNTYLSFTHTSYLSLYELIAWVISAELLLRCNNHLKYRTTKILLWANLLIFPPHIFFLQSKIGCLLLVITLPIYIVRALNRNQRRYGLTIFTLVAIMGCAALYIHMAKGDDKQHRLVNSIIKFKNDNPSNPTESSAIRVAIWKNALEINKEHWLCGIGAGDVSNELHNKAIEHQYTYIASGDFNCHNQFLQVWLGLGIVGLLLFIGIFATAFLICARNRNMGGCIIIVIFAFNLFVECMLERYAGATLIPIATVIICSIPPTMLSSGKLASHSREALPSTSCA